MSGFSVTPVEGLPELREGDDLAALIAERVELADGDVVVVAQKAISKVEGCIVALADVEPSEQARELAGDEADARRIQVILDEAVELVRVRPPLIIARTRHGYVCGSAGVDASNAPKRETVVLLPPDSDVSAARLREDLRELTGAAVGVIVTDSFGRPWRAATTDVAIGAAGVEVVRDLMGEHDPNGYELHATRIAVGDEIAGAAQLVFGKLDRVPVALVRGLDVVRGRRAGAPTSSSRPRRISSVRTRRWPTVTRSSRQTPSSGSVATRSATSPCTRARSARRCSRETRSSAR